MADKPIKVLLLEGDFAPLSALGFPLSLSLQLQHSCMSLADAMWTAKSTKDGFSVSFFWPVSDSAKPDAQPKRKRKRRRRAKASKVVPTKANSEPPMLSRMAASLLGTPSAPNNATSSMLTNTCSPARTHRNDRGCDVNSQSDAETVTETEQQWTIVTSRRKRKAHLPPCWKLKVPVHLRANVQTPNDSTSEEMDTERSDGWDVPKSSEQSPVAARTRSMLRPSFCVPSDVSSLYWLCFGCQLTLADRQYFLLVL